MDAHFQRVAHRGGSLLAPENTLAAFRHALTWPIDAIELDLQMSCDGHAVVFHDNTVERLTNGTGNILNLDLAYLRSLDAAAHFSGGWPEPQQIPTLHEVLALAKGRVQVYIEIKLAQQDGLYTSYPHIAETVVSEVQEAGMLDQVIVISFDWPILAEIKALEATIATGAIVSRNVWKPEPKQALETLIEQVQSLGCSWVNLDDRLFTAEILETVHRHHLKLGIWTVNTLSRLRTLAASGVDSLTTDRPDFFSAIS